MTHGTRVYLDALVDELKDAGVIARDAELASVDELLAALEGASGTTARLIDIPPLEVEGLKRTLTDLREDAEGLPSPSELAGVYSALVHEADREEKSVLEVSVGIGLAFFNSARAVGQAAPARPVQGGLEARARRRIRRLRAPRRPPVRAGGRTPLRPGTTNAHREGDREHGAK